MTAILFLIFVALMIAIVGGLIALYINRQAAVVALAALSAWFIYVGLIAYSGVARNTAMRPPGIAFVVFPVIVFLFLFILRTSRTPAIAIAFPLWILLVTQSFRIAVELFLHRLWIIGLVPRMLTFSGANVDIYIGVTAPLIAWLSARGRFGMRLTLVWNVLGLLALANVVLRAVLTAPGPFNLIHAEVPNLMLGTFPYLLIPAFFVPLAVVLHILSLEACFTGRTQCGPMN